MKTIIIANQKGGVGKTTTASALASGLVLRGARVLAVDLDPQGNLTSSAGINPEEVSTLDDVLSGRKQLSEVIIKNLSIGDLVPSTLDLSDGDRRFTQYGAHRLLKKHLQSVESQYDYAILDAPPSLGILSLNALVAADEIVIPVNTAAFSLQGIQSLWKIIEEVRIDNPSLRIAGILVTRYTPRTLVSKDVMEVLVAIAETLGSKVFSAKIRQAVAIEASQAEQKDIFSFSPKSAVAHDYSLFIDELLKDMEER